MIFDTHAHYDDEQFNPDREELLLSMKDGGVGTIMNVSASFESCRKVLDLAHQYPFLYAAIGVHPDHVGELDDEKVLKMRELLLDEKALAVGEIGLDYYWKEESEEIQKKWFIRQLELAKDMNFPVIIHSRDAAYDTLEIMKEYGKDLSGVIHCFSYSLEIAMQYVKMGYYIGIGGVVTFKNGRKLKEVAKMVPLSSIVLETDCPYLAPVPNRGKRNNSMNLTFVAEEIASIKGISVNEVIEETEKNARNLYRL